MAENQKTNLATVCFSSGVGNTLQIKFPEVVSSQKDNTEYIYYTEEGQYLGGNTNSNKVFISTKNEYDKAKEKGNWNLLNIESNILKEGTKSITHNFLIDTAGIIFAESSQYRYNKNNFPEELKYEMFALASVYKANKVAFAKNTDTKKKYVGRTSQQRNNAKSDKLAIEAIIKVYLLNKEKDWSNGADMWDGAEQAMYPIGEDSFFIERGKGRIELHMNTMGWRISEEHYQKWKKGVTNLGVIFKAPKEKFTSSLETPPTINLTSYQKQKMKEWEKTVLFKDKEEYIKAMKELEKKEVFEKNKKEKEKNRNLRFYSENTISLQSRAVYLGTIFWKSEDNIEKRIKK